MSRVIYPNLVAEMAKRKISQKELADKLGLNKVAIHYRLYGQVPWKINEINLILNEFKTKYEYLFKEN